MTKRKKLGDCYQVALHLMFESDDYDDTWRLCHGEPTGQGPIAGVVHGHAWVEFTEAQEIPVFPADWSAEHVAAMTRMLESARVTVIDKSNGKNGVFPAPLYYGIGNIDGSEVKRYTKDEAAKLAVKFQHYGPWDDDEG